LRELTPAHRLEAYYRVVAQVSEEISPTEAVKDVAVTFSVSRQCIRRLWQRGKENNGDLSSNKSGARGRKKAELDKEKVRKVPFSQRHNI
jgi:transposase